jgi:hypothetical protein
VRGLMMYTSPLPMSGSTAAAATAVAAPGSLLTPPPSPALPQQFRV